MVGCKPLPAGRPPPWLTNKRLQPVTWEPAGASRDLRADSRERGTCKSHIHHTPEPRPAQSTFGEEGAQPGLSPQAKVLSGSGLGDPLGHKARNNRTRANRNRQDTQNRTANTQAPRKSPHFLPWRVNGLRWLLHLNKCCKTILLAWTKPQAGRTVTRV